MLHIEFDPFARTLVPNVEREKERMCATGNENKGQELWRNNGVVRMHEFQIETKLLKNQFKANRLVC